MIASRISVLVIVVILAACSGTMNPPPATEFNAQYRGYAYFWEDVPSLNRSSGASATWRRALDSSTATLIAVPDSGAIDTVLLRHDTAGWHYSPQDYRHACAFPPIIRETRDSLLVSLAYGYSGTDYYLRKK